MSILWILNGCGLEGCGITGAPVRFHAISSRLAARGVDQRLVTTAGGRTMLSSLGCTLPMRLIPASLFLRREPCVPFRLWSYCVSSVHALFAHCGTASHVITVSDYFCDVIPALRVKRRTGARWIAWIHHCETDPSQRPGNRLVNELMYRLQAWSFRRIARHADAAWINDSLAGDEIEARLRALGMPRERIRRMWNGLDAAAIRRAPMPSAPRYDAVMVGVRPNKGLHDILPVWQRVLERRPGSTLLLMGGMSGEAELLREIESLHLPISVFRSSHGLLSAADYYAKLKEARILFAPSHEEGWGIAVGEALAAGLPVVAYDLPAYRKVYPDACDVVPCFDRAALADRVVALLNDPAACAAQAARGQRIVSRYDWDAIAASDYAALVGDGPSR